MTIDSLAHPITGAYGPHRGARQAVAANGQVLRAFAAMVLILAAVRLAICLNSDLIIFPDTPAYWTNARYFRDFDFRNYAGWRTPIYPLLILACGFNLDAVRVLQSALGIAVASMLFWIVHRGTRSWPLAFLAGLVYGLSLRPLVFESAILSETMCTFLLMLSVLIFARIAFGGGSGLRDHALLGVATALTVLCRPFYVFLGPLFFVLLMAENRRHGTNLRDGMKRLAIFAALSAAPVIGWCAFNQNTIGYFGLSTQLGIDLADHCGPFIELAPPRYAEIRDKFLAVRKAMIARTGASQYAAFEAFVSQVPAKLVPMSRELTMMALQMFAEHPIRYAETVGEALRSFWTGVPDERPDHVRAAALAGWVWAAWRVEQMLLPILNAAFIIFAAIALSRLARGRPPPLFDLSMMAIVLAASVLSSMVVYEENNRFYTPTYPLVLYVVMVSAWRYIPAGAWGPRWKIFSAVGFFLALACGVAGYRAWEQGMAARAESAADGWLKPIDECAAEKCWDQPNGPAGIFREVARFRRDSAGRVQSRRLKLARYDTDPPFRFPGRYMVIEFDSSFQGLSPAKEIVTAILGPDGQWHFADYQIAPPEQYFAGWVGLPRLIR